MSIVDDVNGQLKDAMRAQDKDRLRALRSIRAAFIQAMKEDGRDSLPDDEALVLLRRQAKTRLESIEAYEAGGRPELAAEERAELAIIEGFLPQMADEATVRDWVQEAIAATGATGPKETGKVMGHVMAQHKGEADGKVVQKLVKELLG